MEHMHNQNECNSHNESECCCCCASAGLSFKKQKKIPWYKENAEARVILLRIVSAIIAFFAVSAFKENHNSNYIFQTEFFSLPVSLLYIIPYIII
ncbi:MAG: hypothetical protein R3Y36_05995, partial [Spirochaetales bacterium]